MPRIILFFSLFLLTACTREEITNSIRGSMENSCRNHPGKCTVYGDPGKSKP